MKKLLLGVLIMGILTNFRSCFGNIINKPGEDPGAENGEEVLFAEEGVVDYSTLPENFMIQLNPDTEYTLKNGDTETKLLARTHAKLKKNQVLTWGEATYDLSSVVYFRKSEPVLIRLNGNDYLWICEQDKTGHFLSASYFFVNEYGYINSDNGMIDITIKDKVIDPADFVMDTNIHCFGDAKTEVHYTINEHGKPAKIPGEDKFNYIIEPWCNEELVLESDINTWVYADANAEESTVEKVPAGTVFKRYRVPINAEYKYVEGILEDGRVMRVVEEYWFSEPTAYQAIMDKDGEQFSYSDKQ